MTFLLPFALRPRGIKYRKPFLFVLQDDGDSVSRVFWAADVHVDFESINFNL